MKTYLTVILIGLVSGFIGILPLMRKKMDKYSLIAVFVFFLMMPYVVFHVNIPIQQWWLRGSVVCLALIIPLAIGAARGYTKCIFPMLLMAVVVGTMISFLGHFLL